MPRILLVEDDRSIVENLKEFLKKEGFEVDVAMRQSEALDKTAQMAYDLLLLDISLPDGNGMRFVQQSRPISIYRLYF